MWAERNVAGEAEHLPRVLSVLVNMLSMSLPIKNMIQRLVACCGSKRASGVPTLPWREGKCSASIILDCLISPLFSLRSSVGAFAL